MADLKCPLTGRYFIDPIKAPDGNFYEFTEYIKEHGYEGITRDVEFTNSCGHREDNKIKIDHEYVIELCINNMVDELKKYLELNKRYKISLYAWHILKKKYIYGNSKMMEIFINKTSFEFNQIRDEFITGKIPIENIHRFTKEEYAVLDIISSLDYKVDIANEKIKTICLHQSYVSDYTKLFNKLFTDYNYFNIIYDNDYHYLKYLSKINLDKIEVGSIMFTHANSIFNLLGIKNDNINDIVFSYIRQNKCNLNVDVFMMEQLDRITCDIEKVKKVWEIFDITLDEIVKKYDKFLVSYLANNNYIDEIIYLRDTIGLSLTPFEYVNFIEYNTLIFLIQSNLLVIDYDFISGLIFMNCITVDYFEKFIFNDIVTFDLDDVNLAIFSDNIYITITNNMVKKINILCDYLVKTDIQILYNQLTNESYYLYIDTLYHLYDVYNINYYDYVNPSRIMRSDEQDFKKFVSIAQQYLNMCTKYDNSENIIHLVSLYLLNDEFTRETFYKLMHCIIENDKENVFVTKLFGEYIITAQSTSAIYKKYELYKYVVTNIDLCEKYGIDTIEVKWPGEFLMFKNSKKYKNVIQFIREYKYYDSLLINN